jgi:hypothetical protein
MTQHARFGVATDVPAWFCELRRPSVWLRGLSPDPGWSLASALG